MKKKFFLFLQPVENGWIVTRRDEILGKSESTEHHIAKTEDDIISLVRAHYAAFALPKDYCGEKLAKDLGEQLNSPKVNKAQQAESYRQHIKEIYG